MRAMHPFLRSTQYAIVALASFSLACGDDSGQDPEAGGTYLSATPVANPHNSISASVAIRATGYDSAYVRFWAAGADTQRTPAFPVDQDDSSATIRVLGLDTLTDYSFEIRMQRRGGNAKAVDTVAFTTGGYPAWIPRAGVSGTDTTPGYLLVSYPQGAVIINNQAKILWYRERPGGALGSWTAHGGVYTWLSNADSTGFFVHDAMGEETGRLGCQGGFKTRFHDVLVTDEDGAYVMCDEIVEMDLSGMGGDAEAQVYNTVIQHITPAGAVDFEWHALDHMEITDLPLASRTGPNVNFNHTNAITLDTDGNILISNRSLNEITKISRTTGDILWRLGGLANQFTLVNDTKGSFSFQHGVRVVSPNVIQFLDNGDAAPSRVVRYQIDPVAHTATLLLDFRDSPTTWASAGGSTNMLAGGNGVVSFGPAGRVIEYSATGQRRWELTGIEGRYVFRTQRITDLYHPGR